MTVAELKAELDSYPDDAIVVLADWNENYRNPWPLQHDDITLVLDETLFDDTRCAKALKLGKD